MRAGSGFAAHLGVALSLQHGNAAIVHRQHHRGGTALFRHALHDVSGAIQSKPETARFFGTESAQQPYRRQCGDRFGRKCSFAVNCVSFFADGAGTDMLQRCLVFYCNSCQCSSSLRLSPNRKHEERRLRS